MATYIENITPTDVRDLTGLSISDISDAQITTIISGSVVNFNHDVFVRHKHWYVLAIDSYRENKVDGSNTIFYVPDFPLADYNNDGKLDGNDFEVYQVQSGGTDSSSTRTDLTVSSILDDEQGKIQLTTAPSRGSILRISWSASPLEIETPDPMIKRAIVQLAASMSYSRLDVGKLGGFKVGKVTVMQQSQAFKKYMADYQRTVQQILSKRLTVRKEFGLI